MRGTHLRTSRSNVAADVFTRKALCTSTTATQLRIKSRSSASAAIESSLTKKLSSSTNVTRLLTSRQLRATQLLTKPPLSTLCTNICATRWLTLSLLYSFRISARASRPLAKALLSTLHLSILGTRTPLRSQSTSQHPRSRFSAKRAYCQLPKTTAKRNLVAMTHPPARSLLRVVRVTALSPTKMFAASTSTTFSLTKPFSTSKIPNSSSLMTRPCLNSRSFTTTKQATLSAMISRPHPSQHHNDAYIIGRLACFSGVCASCN